MTPLLQADRAELAQALNLLSSSIGRRGGAEAVFRYKDGLLVISYSGVTASVSATGDWQGEARVAGAVVHSLAKTLPKADPLQLRVEKGRLYSPGEESPIGRARRPPERSEAASLAARSGNGRR